MVQVGLLKVYGRTSSHVSSAFAAVVRRSTSRQQRHLEIGPGGETTNEPYPIDN